MVNPSQASKHMDIGQPANVRHLLRADTLARTLYGKWSVAAGVKVPWERLSTQEREAWILLVTDVQPQCFKHGRDLVCPLCQYEER